MRLHAYLSYIRMFVGVALIHLSLYGVFHISKDDLRSYQTLLSICNKEYIYLFDYDVN